jgi:hypothetical protein
MDDLLAQFAAEFSLKYQVESESSNKTVFLGALARPVRQFFEKEFVSRCNRRWLHTDVEARRRLLLDSCYMKTKKLREGM